MESIEAGKAYLVGYPFFRTSYHKFDGDAMPVKTETWRPGCDKEVGDDDEHTWFSDGHGEMILEVVAEYKPGRFPARVFFTRKWKDPDGKVFGLSKLRITTRANFLRLLKGYRHEYVSEAV